MSLSTQVQTIQALFFSTALGGPCVAISKAIADVRKTIAEFSEDELQNLAPGHPLAIATEAQPWPKDLERLMVELNLIGKTRMAQQAIVRARVDGLQQVVVHHRSPLGTRIYAASASDGSLSADKIGEIERLFQCQTRR